MQVSLIALTVYVVTGCHGFRYGPPMDACADMYPTGHGFDAQTSDPPFHFAVDKNQYSPGDVIQISFTSDKNPNNPKEWFAEGVLIQMRTFDCNNDYSVGTFQISDCDDFLQTIDCFGLKNSAIRHYGHLHVYNKTFTWTAPDRAVGHVYLRATMARNISVFWTNVFSETIRDSSDSTVAGDRCPVRTKDKVNGATGLSASLALFLGVTFPTLLP